MIGMYIDDFYVMMCTPETGSFARHGAATPTPCVPISAMDTMRHKMQEINPRIAFMPLVYHLQTPYIAPNSWVMGAGEHVAFLPPAVAAVSVRLAVLGPSSRRLRFFYHCTLSAWSTHKPWAKPTAKPVAGLVQFEAYVQEQSPPQLDCQIPLSDF